MEENHNEEQLQEEETEFGHLDKVTGVFTEPGVTFSKIDADNAKATDWLIPLLLVIIAAVMSNYLMMTNPVLKQKIVDQQMETVNKQLQEAVEKGQISQEVADEQSDMIRDRMKQQGENMAIQIIFMVIFFFLLFFIVAGFFYLINRFAMQDQFTFPQILSVFGLTSYISVVQIIVILVIALVTDSMVTSTSVTQFAEMDIHSIDGYLLSYIDPFRIWYWVVLAIGFAKIGKSETNRYLFLVFAIWLVFGVGIFFLSKAIPFLQFMLR